MRPRTSGFFSFRRLYSGPSTWGGGEGCDRVRAKVRVKARVKVSVEFTVKSTYNKWSCTNDQA